MFKIGEFSRLTQVSVRMLRYYDDMGLLRPAEVDAASGYRFYSVGQIGTLRRILFLRELGLSVAETARVLPNWRDDLLRERLLEQEAAVRASILAEEQKLRKITQAIEDIGRARVDVHSGVTLKALPAYPVLSLRRVIPSYHHEGMLWKELAAIAEKRRWPVSMDNETFALYHDPDYRERDVDVEICMVCDFTASDSEGAAFRLTEAVPLAACTMITGSFENIAPAYLALAEWLALHSEYDMLAPSRQIVHRGQWNEPDPAQYLTEIQVPVTRRGSVEECQ